ncbi:MAG: chitobiase/beta-hexosaminidase C-terminal domain-containing protein, partial [Terracidiphilus sp.]
QDYSGASPTTTPTFSLAAGAYTSAQTVNIIDATTGATIYYTTNGTTPTTSSTVYTGAITVSASETLEAVATAPGYLPSAAASAAYTINLDSVGCPSGSGSCFDNFTGTSGMLLPTYNSQWALAGGTNSIYTSGTDSAEISGSASAVYYYAGSRSNTSQITLAPSSTTIGYEKLACVRVSSGIPGYCVGFSAVSSGNYSACYVMKNFKYLGGGDCGTVSATVSHTLALVASGTSAVTLSIYVDGVLSGTVTDSSSPYTVAGSGFGMQGDGAPADSIVSEWQDYAGASPAPNDCPTGSGSCVDNFAGSSGTLLPAYNSKWTLAGGANSIYTTGSDSAEISGSASAVYYYAASASDTAQITLAPSNTTIGYAKLACVRVSTGIPGYCVGFSAVSSGNYTACYVMKNFKYLGGGNCGTVSATASHTLALVASGTSTVTLSIYVDGVLKGTVTDSSSPYTMPGSGFGLQGDGTPADSVVNEWQDFSGASATAAQVISPVSRMDIFQVKEYR